MYLGCSKCSKRRNGERGASIQCPCNRSDCTLVPRMNCNFDVHDATGSLAFTAFTEDAKMLLNVRVNELYDMPDEERLQFFEKASTTWAHGSFYMHIGPAATPLV